MKVSLSWLKNYIPVDYDADDLSARLTMAGLEVDAVEPLFGHLDTVVVGRVVERKQHPNADKLSCCQVDVGGDEPLSIVCGAPNVRQDMMVACATVGTVMPSGMKIKKSKLRGEPSQGMLCSAAELKLASDADGIMDLDVDAAPGTPIKDALDLHDTVVEIDLTPNRPDCLSLIGVAREIGAFKRPGDTVTKPDVELNADTIGKGKMGDQKIEDFAKVTLEDPELCPRYAAGMLFDVKVGPSPAWLQQRLEAVGLAPINNVVDITNFVMMETGQPLHAFDYDNLADGHIIVKAAGAGVEFTTLDSKSHKMEEDALMICDAERPVAIAGVMGGENSEISDTTTRVLVESAYFNPVSVRRTAKRTGIATDASHRFERGVDPEGPVYALKRALALMADLCEATLAPEIIDEYPKAFEPVTVNLTSKALNIRLGTDFSDEEIAEILKSVEFGVDITAPGEMVVCVPTFRVDVTRPEDLSEEVARLWGYNKIETSYPLVRAQGKPVAPQILARKSVRTILNGFGFFEAINYNFIHRESCDRLNLTEGDARRQVVDILNPISEQMAVLRTSLIPGLLETMKRNTAQQMDSLQLFEIGKTFFPTTKDELPKEVEMVSGLICGNRADQTWYSKKEALDFYDLKGAVQGLLDGLGIDGAQYALIQDDSHPFLEAGHAATVCVGDTCIGVLGKVDSDALANYGLKQDAFVFDLELSALMALSPETFTAHGLPRFPAISRDITLVVDAGVEVAEIHALMDQRFGKEALLEEIYLFDLYQGKPLPEGKKSLSFRLVYRSESKTLTEKNIRKIHDRISSTLLDGFNAVLPE